VDDSLAWADFSTFISKQLNIDAYEGSTGLAINETAKAAGRIRLIQKDVRLALSTPT
jgi:hypothetical protein